jgi:molybdopterin synthase catalytic subunit
MIEITEGPIDHAAITDRVRLNLAGAVCTFLGTVREMTGDRRTARLEYEAYPEMALAKMDGLEREARVRWPILDAALVHRVGRLELGEISVVVAVSCPHRGDSFEACRWLIDRLKEEVPIWKREVWADGTEEWVQPGPAPSVGHTSAGATPHPNPPPQGGREPNSPSPLAGEGRGRGQPQEEP